MAKTKLYLCAFFVYDRKTLPQLTFMFDAKQFICKTTNFDFVGNIIPIYMFDGRMNLI